MQEYMNLRLIGTSHISADSINEIKTEVKKEKPNFMAVELDKGRLVQLMSTEKQKFSFGSMFQVGFFGFAFAIIGRVAQKKLGKFVGIDPGSEMKEAVKVAKKEKINLLLIDQDIRITLQRFSKQFTWKEAFQIGKDILMAMFGKGQKIPFDLKKVPSKKVITLMLDEMKQKYPNIHNVLVHERNVVMAKRLIAVMKKHPEEKIIAVVGAGHEDEMMNIIKQGFSSYSYSFSVNQQ